MAISNNRPDGTGTEQRFNANNGTQGDAAAKARQEQVELERVSYTNLLRMKREAERSQKQIENLQKLYEEEAAKYERAMKEVSERIAKNTRDTSQKIKANAALRIDKEREAAEKEREQIEEAWRQRQESIREQEEELKKTTKAYEEGTKVLQESYGVTLEEFESFKKLGEEQVTIIKQIDEANEVLEHTIRSKAEKIKQLTEELQKLSDGDIEGSRAILEELDKTRGELKSAQKSQRSNRAKKQAAEKTLFKNGLNIDGSKLDAFDSKEEGINRAVNFTAAKAGGRLGARFGPYGAVIGTVAGAVIGSKLSDSDSKSAVHSGLDNLQNSADAEDNPLEDGIIPDQLEDIVGKLGPVGKILSVADSILEVTSVIASQLTQYIDQAAEQMKSYYGAINANLEQSAYNYRDISEKADNFLTSSRWVKQTDYLAAIADISNSGLLRDIETAAILETIKNKTLTSFDTTNEGIQRLIRLNESDYIRQFGIETQLKKVLNSVFNDSGYLSSMFDSVTSAIMDAASSYSGDVTAFNSTVQTWMGFMYSSGLSSNVINQIAEGINNLGSGNLQALSGNEQTQRLFLLAMDRVGMDYADVLQQGLSLDDTNTLLSSIVKYLDEIVGNTSDNNVLRSSYANLFNMSISDMRAIHQLASQSSSIGNYAISSGGAMAQTVNALTNTLQQSTSVAEEFDNLISNFQYTLGESIAESSGKYSVYRISSETRKVLKPFTGIKGGVGKISRIADKLAAVAQYPVLALGLINGIGEFGTSIFNNVAGEGLTAFLSSSLTNNISSMDNASLTTMLANANSTSTSNSAQLKTLNRTTLKSGGMDKIMTNTYSEEEMNADEEEGNDVKILKEMAKTLMQTKEEGHYAFAVSLEGMNNNVLRSFASIFADEDAMAKTFTGENTAIKDSLFNYMGDTTSNAGTSDAKNQVAKGNVSATDTQKAASKKKNKKKK